MKDCSIRIFLFGIVGGLTAALFNFFIYHIGASAGLIYQPQFSNGVHGSITSWDVFVCSFVPAILASLFLINLKRFSRKPYKVLLFFILAALLTSFLPLKAINLTYARVLLSSMHIITVLSVSISLYFGYKVPATTTEKNKLNQD